LHAGFSPLHSANVGEALVQESPVARRTADEIGIARCFGRSFTKQGSALTEQKNTCILYKIVQVAQPYRRETSGYTGALSLPQVTHLRMHYYIKLVCATPGSIGLKNESIKKSLSLYQEENASLKLSLL
jgi:hypothetical protein